MACNIWLTKSGSDQAVVVCNRAKTVKSWENACFSIADDLLSLAYPYKWRVKELEDVLNKCKLLSENL